MKVTYFVLQFHIKFSKDSLKKLLTYLDGTFFSIFSAFYFFSFFFQNFRSDDSGGLSRAASASPTNINDEGSLFEGKDFELV